MKKLTGLFLVFAIVCSLCACTAQPKLEGLCVGYARQDITPSVSVPMAGYSNALSRMSTGTLDKLYATCIAITEGEDTVLIFSEDLIGADEPVCSQARQAVFAATGIPVSRIMIAGTHTHAGPALTENHPNVETYQAEYLAAMVQCAKDALADRSSATMYANDVEVPGLNFVRHYKMEDGSVKSANTNLFDPGAVSDYAMEIDDEMVLVKFDRKDKKKQDILLMNWQAHPCYTGGGGLSTQFSADFIGAVRDSVESQTGLHFIYLTGGAGNQTTDTYIEEDKHHLDMQGYGDALAKAAIDALPSLREIQGEGIRTATVRFEYLTNRDEIGKIAEAKEVVQVWQQEGKLAGERKAAEYGFTSVHHASSVAGRAQRPSADSMELNALYAAGIAFVTAPYEMFSNAGIYIKDNSPFDITVVCSTANGRYSYVPCADAYDYYAYEALTSYFAKGCSEDAAQQFVNMLKSLQ